MDEETLRRVVREEIERARPLPEYRGRPLPRPASPPLHPMYYDHWYVPPVTCGREGWGGLG